MGTEKPTPLQDQYSSGKNIVKPTVVKEIEHYWTTLGGDHPWGGCIHDTFEEAIKEALNGHQR